MRRLERRVVGEPRRLERERLAVVPVAERAAVRVLAAVEDEYTLNPRSTE